MKKFIFIVLSFVITVGVEANAVQKKSPSALTTIEKCNAILNGSSQAPLAAFQAMFADYAPVEMKHVQYKNEMVEAPNIVAANEWNKRARSAAQLFPFLSRLTGQLAFLVKDTTGGYQILIGTPIVQTDILTRQFYMVEQFVPNPKRREWHVGGQTYGIGRIGSTEYTHPVFEGRYPTTLSVTQSNGKIVTVPFDSVVAYTARELSDREALFDREFPVAYKGPQTQWESTKYLQSLYNSSRIGQSGVAEMQKKIDGYRSWIEQLARQKKPLAVLLNEPSGQKFVIGTVEPILGTINSYTAIIGVRIKTSDGYTFERQIAPNNSMPGVLRMTNDTISKLTKKTAKQLEREFSKPSIAVK